jgi:hypothetical protein
MAISLLNDAKLHGWRLISLDIVMLGEQLEAGDQVRLIELFIGLQEKLGVPGHSVGV